MSDDVQDLREQLQATQAEADRWATLFAESHEIIRTLQAEIAVLRSELEQGGADDVEEDPVIVNFIKALQPDVIIRGVGKPGPQSLPEMLATRVWFDQRRADLEVEDVAQARLRENTLSRPVNLDDVAAELELGVYALEVLENDEWVEFGRGWKTETAALIDAQHQLPKDAEHRAVLVWDEEPHDLTEYLRLIEQMAGMLNQWETVAHDLLKAKPKTAGPYQKKKYLRRSVTDTTAASRELLEDAATILEDNR